MKRTALRGLAVTLAVLAPTVALAGLTSGAAAAESVPAPSGVTVDIVAVQGSACDASTAHGALGSDGRSFAVRYDEFTSGTNQPNLASGNTRVCHLVLKVNAPQGYTYTLSRVSLQGFLQVVGGDRIQIRGAYYFEGMSRVTTYHEYYMPMAAEWQGADQFTNHDLGWVPCGETRNLVLDSQLKVVKGNNSAMSYVTMDAMDAIEFEWADCVATS